MENSTINWDLPKEDPEKTLPKFNYAPVVEDILYEHKITNTRNFTYPYHRHDGYEIYLFLGGKVHCYIEQACYPLQRGDLITFHPEEMHRVVCLDDLTYERISINIKPLCVHNLSMPSTNLSSCFEHRPLGKNNITRLTNQEVNHFILLSHHLGDALCTSGYGSDVMSNVALAQLLLLVNLAYQKHSVQVKDIMPELISQTMSYIDEHLLGDITLKKLSNEFFTSGTYISRQFKKHTGLTLRSYILDKRISLAKTQLASGKSVTEACYLSGFSDYANFIRSFTKLTGISPGRFLRS
ncbi:MAG: AraC family transcriptional regulator [Herbinix sp.]|jgi:AraC-like DNA-binding protein|nr:AraC family transcriptional regulator [Herbinix sp.]